MAVRVPKSIASRDPEILAPLAGLRYVTLPPGWTRRLCGRGFTFVDDKGRVIRGRQRQRLEDLVVPPAWTDVWLAPTADAYLQATGSDAAGRRQYRYHDDFRSLCDERKFARLRYFGRALPDLRRRTTQLLAESPGTREQAIGAVLGVIDSGLLRIGNERSAQDGHHGATTLAADHVVDDGFVTLCYRAKGGKERSVVIEDEYLSDVLRSLTASAGEHLFSFIDDDGDEHMVSARDVNAVIAEVAGPCFSAKDFRTWGGSRFALEARVDGAEPLEAIDAAAEALGNTRAVARSAYVHPTVLDAPAGQITEIWRRSRSSDHRSRGDSALAKLLASAPVKGN